MKHDLGKGKAVSMPDFFRGGIQLSAVPRVRLLKRNSAQVQSA